MSVLWYNNGLKGIEVLLTLILGNLRVTEWPLIRWLSVIKAVTGHLSLFLCCKIWGGNAFWGHCDGGFKSVFFRVYILKWIFAGERGFGLYAFSIRVPIPIDTKKPPYIAGWFFVLIKYYYLVCVIISVVMVVANEANEIHTEGVLKVLPTAFDSRLRLSLGAT